MCHDDLGGCVSVLREAAPGVDLDFELASPFLAEPPVVDDQPRGQPGREQRNQPRPAMDPRKVADVVAATDAHGISVQQAKADAQEQDHGAGADQNVEACAVPEAAVVRRDAGWFAGLGDLLHLPQCRDILELLDGHAVLVDVQEVLGQFLAGGCLLGRRALDVAEHLDDAGLAVVLIVVAVALPVANDERDQHDHEDHDQGGLEAVAECSPHGTKPIAEAELCCVARHECTPLHLGLYRTVNRLLCTLLAVRYNKKCNKIVGV